ncbi:MAG: hypothetical protein ACI9BV_000258 [Rhodothermales bacterium]|jgi:hypothetical protein
MRLLLAPLALLIVKVSVLTPPGTMVAGEKALEKRTPAATVSVALDVPAEPAEVESAPEVFTYADAVDDVTVTVMVQIELEATDAPASVITVPPSAPVSVPVSRPLFRLQVVERFPGVAITTLAGSVFVNPIADTAVPDAELLIVYVRTLVLPETIEVGENAWLNVGCATLALPAKRNSTSKGATKEKRTCLKDTTFKTGTIEERESTFPYAGGRINMREYSVRRECRKTIQR